MSELACELRCWLDQQTITSDNIGDFRRRLFVPWDSMWNGIVREETAARENKPPRMLPASTNDGLTGAPAAPGPGGSSLTGCSRPPLSLQFHQHGPKAWTWCIVGERGRQFGFGEYQSTEAEAREDALCFLRAVARGEVEIDETL